jgi:hypothetical protein
MTEKKSSITAVGSENEEGITKIKKKIAFKCYQFNATYSEFTRC